jgi:site-specific recombinase XerC
MGGFITILSELWQAYIEDLNWENSSAIVKGKGSKQREVYFTTQCKVWLKKYLASREDSCKALFVTDAHPYAAYGHSDDQVDPETSR